MHALLLEGTTPFESSSKCQKYTFNSQISNLAISIYTKVSRLITEAGASPFSDDLDLCTNISLRIHMNVIQTKLVLGVNVVLEHIRRQHIRSFRDSRAVLLALTSCRITSGLVYDITTMRLTD